MCSIDADTWSEAQITKDTEKKQRVWKTVDMNSEITTHNRYDVLQNIDEKITATEIMKVSIGEMPRRDKMRAKGRITMDSGAAESVIPKDMLKEYVTTKESKMKDTVHTSADGGRGTMAAGSSTFDLQVGGSARTWRTSSVDRHHQRPRDVRHRGGVHVFKYEAV